MFIESYMAEQNLVDGLQNLRVVAAYDLAVMDDLARDFANALEDFPMTVRLRSGANEQVRRRRFRKRRPKGTLPICSESDSDQEKMVTNDSSHKKCSDSDSDDLEICTRQRYSLSRFPATSAPLLVESDSVTDCLPQSHPPRRRKFLKKPDEERSAGEKVNLSKDLKCKIKLLSSINSGHLSLLGCVRKRKRSVRESRIPLETCDTHGELITDRLFGPCSCKSDAENSTGEGRDGDDEQSDFYFEPDQSHRLGPPSKLLTNSFLSPSQYGCSTLDKQSPGKCPLGRQRELRMRRHVTMNHVLRNFLDEKVQIAPNGRLFIPAKRRLGSPKDEENVDECEDETNDHNMVNSSANMDTLHTSTPLSSPPLSCHKRHKCCHEADASHPHLHVSMNRREHTSCESKTRKKKILSLISGWLS